MGGPKASAKDREIGARLQRRREALGLLRREVAQAAGISEQAYRKWEEGLTRMTLARLGRIAGILQASASELHGEPYIAAGLPTPGTPSASEQGEDGGLPATWTRIDSEEVARKAEVLIHAIADALQSAQRRL